MAKIGIITERDQTFHLPTNYALFHWISAEVSQWWVGAVKGISERVSEIRWGPSDGDEKTSTSVISDHADPVSRNPASFSFLIYFQRLHLKTCFLLKYS